jgi:transcriptional regulator with XRE-family HTH domain
MAQECLRLSWRFRQQFSERLKKEFTRMGLPLSSPTQIANEFNSRYPANKIAAQTVRKWLLSDAIPTQAKLMCLAEWIDVSSEWLRFGTGKRRVTKAGVVADRQEEGVVVVGKRQAAIIPVVELLAKLSPQNIRLVENIVRCVLVSQEQD